MSLRFCASMFFLAGLFLSACGTDGLDQSDSTPACPSVEGDKHVSQGDSTPDGIPAMLHIVGRACAGPGENWFHLYRIGSEGVSHMPALSVEPSSMNKDDSLTVTAVEATMPSMGHGTAEAPVLKGNGEFSVNFQMPGEWQLTIEFSTPDTTATQSVVVPVLVK